MDRKIDLGADLGWGLCAIKQLQCGPQLLKRI